MTQEELDAIIAGDVSMDLNDKENETEHHDMAEQLGSVTKESELKATEIFDKLENILEVLKHLKQSPEKLNELLEVIETVIMDIMSSMQYQDIHRQKIERVINNMRSISKLMNQTLNIVDEEDIAPSAKHISGDENEDLMTEEELEALIASMK